ncbi:hypothetical protein HY483_03200, partial [Candidatus Woesearchaeota archaeon]|nr:hypothetical protein [Candidatus Woesearchaeota archaeon]
GANITMTRTGTSCFINRTSQSEGFYNYKIWVNDSAGNINVSSERNVTIDLTNPSLSILRPLNNSHIPAGVTFNFTTNDSYLNNATLYINQIANETNSSGNNGTYIITKIIIDGQYNWSVLAYDKAGNSNQSVAYNFSTETDITAPTVSITNPSTGSGITANFLINTTITDSFTVTSVQYRYENTTSNSSWNIMTQNGNFWTATFNITQSGDGNFTIRINATDDSTNSNTTVTTTSIIIDTVNPTITLNSPANNSIQNSATVNINTTITDSFIYNASLIINGANNETNNSRNSGEYVFTKTLIDGTHNWSIIVYDYVNHTVQSATRTFTIDTGIPNVTINSPTTGWKTTPITINTTVNDGIGTVTNVQYRAETITQNYSWQTLTQSGNSWTATFNNTGINDGNYNIRINATDTATNSNTTQIINISLDTTPPTISSTSVNSTNGTTGDSFTITGTISDAGIGVNNSRIFIRNMKNGTVTTLATTPSGNTYTATWNSGANLNTTYLVDIDVNDSLGNYRVLTARHMITLTPVNTTMATYQNNSLNINTGGQAVFSATLNNNSAVYVRLATQTNISNASVLISMYSANIEGGVPTGKTALGKYFHISLDNNTLANISTARINVTYTASEVTDAGLQESSLKIYRWNPGSSSWSVLDSTGVISGNGIIWGNVSSFSSFGVFGDSTSSDSGGGDSGGSSGGGGGGGGGGGTQKNPTPQESTPQESQQEQANIALGGSRSGSEEQYVTTISRGGGGTVLDSTGGGIACTEITTREKQTVRVNKTVFDSSLLPKGYAVVKDPFSVECKDAEIELTLTLPADYKNITVLKCSQGVCAPTVEKVVERTVLSCGGVDTNVIGEKIVGLKEIALDTLTALPSTEKPITITDRIIESGGYKIEFEGTNELKAGIKELSPVKPLGVKDSTFIETPIIIHTESSEKTPLTIILKYKIPEGIVEDSIEIYTKKGQLWTPAGGNVDKEKDVIELKTSTNITDENGDITIGVVGTVCTTCLQSTLKEVYTGSEDDALILVHGVFARSDTFNSLIAEFALLQQPWTIYVYEYNYNDELVKNGEELSAYIQQYSSRHKNIYLAGHSMGGLVVQEALKQGEKQQSSYIEKVRKAILIATPNTGAPAKELYELLDTAVVNQFINASKFYLSNETLELLTTGKNIPRKEGITYEVVAGNTGYNFTTEYFRDPENPEIVMPNDGIITVKSAQTVGGTKVDNLCKDYYEVGLTHTEINDHPIINRIIARSINEEKTSSNTAGFTQYYKLRITSCDKDDKYVVVGKPIRREESYSVLQCGCGNGYCGLDEDAESCPSDCASFFQKNIAGGAIGITTIVGGTIVLIFVIIAPIIYFIGRLVARRKPT